MRPPLRGIIAAIPTPFGGDEGLRLDALASNLKKWNETPLAGFTVLGTTGEFVSLSTDEKKRVLAAAREIVPADKVFVAGTGAESTRETIALSSWAAEIGCDYAIVVTPHYLKWSISKDALVDHYRRVADACAIPIVVYHIPQCTGFDLTPETVARIAEHENVAGIKDSSGDWKNTEAMLKRFPGFGIFAGSEDFLLANMRAGGVGCITATGNVNAGMIRALYENWQKPDADQRQAHRGHAEHDGRREDQRLRPQRQMRRRDAVAARGPAHREGRAEIDGDEQDQEFRQTQQHEGLGDVVPEDSQHLYVPL